MALLQLRLPKDESHVTSHDITIVIDEYKTSEAFPPSNPHLIQGALI